MRGIRGCGPDRDDGERLTPLAAPFIMAALTIVRNPSFWNALHSCFLSGPESFDEPS